MGWRKGEKGIKVRRDKEEIERCRFTKEATKGFKKVGRKEKEIGRRKGKGVIELEE